MGSAATLALAVGGLTGVSSLATSQTRAAQQRMEADALRAQADVSRQQAEMQRRQGEVEARNYDRQKSQLRREFTATQGKNRSLLAAGNVDMASGSALDVSLGNIDRFAADVGENAYQKALALWSAEQQARTLDAQADIYSAQSSYLRRTAGNLGTSLLTAGLSGLTSGLGVYSMAGGNIAGLFGGAGKSAAGIPTDVRGLAADIAGTPKKKGLAALAGSGRAFAWL